MAQVNDEMLQKLLPLLDQVKKGENLVIRLIGQLLQNGFQISRIREDMTCV